MDKTNSLVLPELPTTEILVEVKDKEFNEFLVSCQKLAAFHNREVPKAKLQEHPIVKGVYYLPISYMEAMLDTVFFGLWKTDNFHYQVVANEIIGSIQLYVFHPYLKDWITRSGANALQIMTDSVPQYEIDKIEDEMLKESGVSSMAELKKDKILKGKLDARLRSFKNVWALNLDNKKPGALANGGFSKLKAECFKNACLSIGKVFGRDVNRDNTHDFMPLVEPIKETIIKKRKEISDLISHSQDEEFNQIIIKEITDAEADGKNDVDFYNSIIKKMKNG